MAGKEINDLSSKATPLDTDEIELQATGGGDSAKATLADVMKLASGKKTKWVPATLMRPQFSSGCAAIATVETTAGRPDMHVLDFDSATEENAQFSITLPKSWNEGPITFRTHHTHAGGQTAGLDGVTWRLTGRAVSNKDNLNISFGAGVAVTVDEATAEDEMVSSESAGITIGGTVVDSVRIIFQITRVVADAGDDLDIDARLLGIEIFYTTNDRDDD